MLNIGDLKMLKTDYNVYIEDYFKDFLIKDIKIYGKVFHITMVKEDLLKAELYIIKDYLRKSVIKGFEKTDNIKNVKNLTLTICKTKLQDYIRIWDNKNRLSLKYLPTTSEEETNVYSDNLANELEDYKFFEVMDLIECLTLRQQTIIIHKLKNDSKLDSNPKKLSNQELYKELGDMLRIKSDTIRKELNNSYKILKKELYGV